MLPAGHTPCGVNAPAGEVGTVTMPTANNAAIDSAIRSWVRSARRFGQVIAPRPTMAAVINSAAGDR
jgi:hypothetical protein